MERPSLQPVLDRLAAWRAEVIQRLRAGDDSALSLKFSLDASIFWLELCERYDLSTQSDVVALPIPGEYAPLGEYRVLWDGETEDRK